MKRWLFTILIAACACALACAQNFSDETLKYKVMYKWGLVNTQAGTVDISLRATPARYDCVLTAASASWADKFYRLRDTLYCQIDRNGYLPIKYEKIAYEANTFEHGIVTYRRNGSTVMGDCYQYKTKDGKLKRDETVTFECLGTTLDMFSAFYYMRALPFQDWASGHAISINVLSGRKKELLTIKFHGIETIKYDDKQYQCYKITFMFTSDGKKKSSDDMEAWITTDARRLPIKLEGKLPVGSVRCFLSNI